MKVIIAGSRSITDYALVEAAIKQSEFSITEVVSGRAKGVDTLGERWAVLRNIPVQLFPADWGALGKAAGAVRNGQMAQYADALIALWDGKSPGTKNMIQQATELGLAVYIHQPTLAKGF